MIVRQVAAASLLLVALVPPSVAHSSDQRRSGGAAFGALTGSHTHCFQKAPRAPRPGGCAGPGANAPAHAWASAPERPPLACIPTEGDDRCEVWVARYSGNAQGGGYESITALGFDPASNRIYATGAGIAAPYEGTAFVTFALDASTGARLWVATREETRGNDTPTVLAVSPDGSTVFVGGWADAVPGEPWSWLVVAYDAATGKERWVMDAGHLGFDGINAVVPAPAGDALYIAGTGYSEDTGEDALTASVDPDTGSGRWVARYDGPAHDHEYVWDKHSLAVAPDGRRVYLAIDSGGGGGEYDYDFAAVAYRAGSDPLAGEEIWSIRREAGDGHQHAAALEVSPDGGTVYVAGGLAPEPGAAEWPTHHALMALDAATGAERWSKVEPASLIGGYSDVDLASGRLATIARVDTGGNLDIEVATHVASTGALLWRDRYHSTRWDEPGDLAISRDGSGVFATGMTGDFLAPPPPVGGMHTQFSFITIAFDGSGKRTWVARYSDDATGTGGWNQPFALAVSPSGSRVVAGGVIGMLSTFLGSYYDMGVVAYDA